MHTHIQNIIENVMKDYKKNQCKRKQYEIHQVKTKNTCHINKVDNASVEGKRILK